MHSILIIEDDPAYLGMMKLILELEGFEVRTAADGRAGLAALRDKRPDLILCDQMMPLMGGSDVLAALQENELLADIPFVFVTALGEREQVRQGMSSGADDYLPKPFSAEELLAAVRGRLRRHAVMKPHQILPDLSTKGAFLRGNVTSREREVLLMVAQGLTSREIADRLAVCPKTVEVHRANLMRKLQVTNAAGLARWAVIAEAERLPSPGGQ